MSKVDWDALEAVLLEAHAREDHASLITHYDKASLLAERENDMDRAAFFATYAWIYALELGEARAAQLESRLRKWGKVDEERQ